MRKLYLIISLFFCSTLLAEAEMNENKNSLDLFPPYSTLSFDLTKKTEFQFEAHPFFLKKELENSHEALQKDPLSLFGSDCSFLKFNDAKNKSSCCFTYWHPYKADFGFEKIYLRFPYAPTINQGSSLVVAYAYEYHVTYSFTAYFPPIGSIDPVVFFDRALFNASEPPFALLSYATHQIGPYSVLDYVMHDTFKDMIVRNRTIVTPFNAYTLQAISPYGHLTRFDYFVDSFKIKPIP